MVLDESLLEVVLVLDVELAAVLVLAVELVLDELSEPLTSAFSRSTMTASVLLLDVELDELELGGGPDGPLAMSCCTVAKALCAVARSPESRALPRVSMSLSICDSLLVEEAEEVEELPVCSWWSFTMVW